MRLLTITLLLFARAVFAENSEVRVEIFAYSDAEPSLASQIEQRLRASLEALDGVITVKKQPDVFVSVTVEPIKLGALDLVMVAYESTDLVPNNVAAASLPRGTSGETVQNMQALLNGLALPGVPFAVIGPRENLAKLCSEIARAIEAVTISRYREHPTDPDPGTSMENFMLRMGARKVITKP